MPGRLSETGLFADTAARALAPDVVPYAPRFALWSDGAEKQRWIALPPGAQIDTANMDDWSFPSGTRLWKQFSVDGVAVETRLLEKRGPADDDWIALAYVWQPDGLDAVAASLGVIDVAGTDHDVPAAGECFACHGGRRSFALGFSAIQLAAPARPGEIDLAGLVAQGRLTAPAATAPVVCASPSTSRARSAASSEVRWSRSACVAASICDDHGTVREPPPAEGVDPIR